MVNDLKQAIELGKFPDGKVVSNEQKELMIEATILYEIPSAETPWKKREPDLFIEKSRLQTCGRHLTSSYPRILIMTDSRAVNSAPSITRLVDYEAFPFSIDSVDLSF